MRQVKMLQFSQNSTHFVKTIKQIDTWTFSLFSFYRAKLYKITLCEKTEIDRGLRFSSRCIGEFTMKIIPFLDANMALQIRVKRENKKGTILQF